MGAAEGILDTPAVGGTRVAEEAAAHTLVAEEHTLVAEDKALSTLPDSKSSQRFKQKNKLKKEQRITNQNENEISDHNPDQIDSGKAYRVAGRVLQELSCNSLAFSGWLGRWRVESEIDVSSSICHGKANEI